MVCTRHEDEQAVLEIFEVAEQKLVLLQRFVHPVTNEYGMMRCFAQVGSNSIAFVVDAKITMFDIPH